MEVTGLWHNGQRARLVVKPVNPIAASRTVGANAGGVKVRGTGVQEGNAMHRVEESKSWCNSSADL